MTERQPVKSQVLNLLRLVKLMEKLASQLGAAGGVPTIRLQALSVDQINQMGQPIIVVYTIVSRAQAYATWRNSAIL